VPFSLSTPNPSPLLLLFLPSTRVTEQAEENKMTASNLGIIFGPTLVKPRQTEAEVSLSSLVDYPYQALMVEQLVRHFQLIFDQASSSSSAADHLLHHHAGGGGQASPRLTPQEKEQRLSRHSTSLLDIKEVRPDVHVHRPLTSPTFPSAVFHKACFIYSRAV